MKYSLIITVLLLGGVAFAEPDLYFGDVTGSPISELTALPGADVTVYIFGQTDQGNAYDFFNLGLSFDPAKLSPLTGVPNQDLVLDTIGNFGPTFGSQQVVYSGQTLLNASATSFGSAPDDFGPALLATAYFTVEETNTQISFFNEPGDGTYSTFFMSVSDFSEVRFSDTLTIVPEPATLILISIGGVVLARRRK